MVKAGQLEQVRCRTMLNVLLWIFGAKSSTSEGTKCPQKLTSFLFKVVLRVFLCSCAPFVIAVCYRASVSQDCYSFIVAYYSKVSPVALRKGKCSCAHTLQKAQTFLQLNCWKWFGLGVCANHAQSEWSHVLIESQRMWKRWQDQWERGGFGWVRK